MAPFLFLPSVVGTKHEREWKCLDRHENGVEANREKFPSGEPSASIGHRLRLLREENERKQSKDQSPMGGSSRQSRGVWGVHLNNPMGVWQLDLMKDNGGEEGFHRR